MCLTYGQGNRIESGRTADAPAEREHHLRNAGHGLRCDCPGRSWQERSAVGTEGNDRHANRGSDGKLCDTAAKKRLAERRQAQEENLHLFKVAVVWFRRPVGFAREVDMRRAASSITINRKGAEALPGVCDVPRFLEQFALCGDNRLLTPLDVSCG